MSDVSIIIDGFGISHDKPLAFLERARPLHTIILNEREKLANPAQEFTQVFFRNVNDDNRFNDPNFDARAFTRELFWGLHPKIGGYLGNEPGYSPTLIEKTCDGMEVCIEQNRPAYLFNFSVFHPSDQFLQDIKDHARFNHLFSSGTFWICGHDYFDESIAQGIQDGAILRPLWFNLEREGYPAAFSEWGYAHQYGAHSGWKRYISQDHYIQQLKVYVNNPDFKRHNFPVHVFMWNVWHDFEVGQALDFQQAVIELNNQKARDDMHIIVGTRAGMRFHVRAGKGTQFSSLGVLDLDNTPVSVLDYDAVNGFYRVHVPSMQITGWTYQSGNSNYGSFGLRKI